jgi:predicted nucleic-acid-binding protein
MTDTTTVNEIAANLTEFHKSQTIAFGGNGNLSATSMTVPPILYHSIKAIYGNKTEQFFKTLAEKTRLEILQSGVQESTLVGKLSTKVQECAWKEIIEEDKQYKVKLTEFVKASVIAYSNTTMTIPHSLLSLCIKEVSMKNVKNPRQFAINKIIKPIAEQIRAKIIEENPHLTSKELKGKVSHKIQENLWLRFIPESIRYQEVNIGKAA